MPQDTGISAGILDKRVTLLAPAYNASQDEIVAWTPIATVWASVAPATGRETNQAGRTVAVTEVAVVIRYRPDIDARWRIEDRERTYQVKSIADVMRRHVQLQIACEEIE